MNPHIAITMGDPAGVGPEIIVKACLAVKDRLARGDVRLLVIGSNQALREARRMLVVGPFPWQLLGVLPGTESIRPYLLGTQFEAWHGFLRTPADWVPVIRAIWVCALYISIPLAAAYRGFLRRDVASQ